MPRLGPALGMIAVVGAVGPTVWRAAEEVDTLPVGAEVKLTGNIDSDQLTEQDEQATNWPQKIWANPRSDELISGKRGIAFRHGRAFHIEEVHEDDLPSFLYRRTPVASAAASSDDFVLNHETCQHGRFLLNDPRVGLFHNQRLSYETALDMASSLGRILVLPGFFKFPHPEAYDGVQWVPFRELFDVAAVQRCYGRVVELEEVIQVCGPEVLDAHVTVPFQTMWMRSKRKAPWINGTRPELRWKSYVFRPNVSEKETPLKLEERLGYMQAAFLKEGVAAAQTIRSHGLIARNVSMADVATCFFPSNRTLDLANSLATTFGLLPSENVTPHVLGIHLRLFKASMKTSGGYLLEETQSMQESLCNLEPEVFTFLASWTMARSFKGFWPTHSYFASNEADEQRLWPYLGGFPGPRLNSYRPHHYDAAVTTEECTVALQSVLVDAIIVSWSEYFIGNVCSTMSQYISQLRLRWGKPFESSLLLGGVQHAHMLEWAREEVQNGWMA